MSRRPPIDQRELLTLLDSGMGQSDAARQMDRSVKTIGGLVRKFRDRGFIPESGETRPVVWEAFEEWERTPAGQKAAAQAKRPQPEAETSDAQDAPVIQPPKAPRTAPADRLTEQDVDGIKTLLDWWRERKLRIAPVSDSTGRKPMLSIRIPEALMAELRIEARAAQTTLTEVVVNRLAEVSFMSDNSDEANDQ